MHNLDVSVVADALQSALIGEFGLATFSAGMIEATYPISGAKNERYIMVGEDKMRLSTPLQKAAASFAILSDLLDAYAILVKEARIAAAKIADDNDDMKANTPRSLVALATLSFL